MMLASGPVSIRVARECKPSGRRKWTRIEGPWLREVFIEVWLTRFSPATGEPNLLPERWNQFDNAPLG